MDDADTYPTDDFWSDRRARRSNGKRGRVSRTRQHTTISRGMRRPPEAAMPPVDPLDPTPAASAGLFDDLPDDPFADDFGLGSYAGLRDDPTADEPQRPGGPAGAPPVDHHIPLERRHHHRRVGVDPVLMRIGVIIAAAVVAVPVLAMFGQDASAEGHVDFSAVETSDDRATTTTTTVAVQAVKRATNRSGDSGPQADSPVGEGPADVATAADSEPELACIGTYEIAAGDYWLRLAEASGSSLDDLLAVNGATVDAPLYPGGEICLPPGASTPSPPTTQAPVTTNAPTTVPTTQAPTTYEQPVYTTAAPTTQATTTTAAPTTAAPPSYGGNVQDIIREVWPDSLEDKALRIAYRESNYVPSAYNGWCCYGLFQIYYDQHTSWLPQAGVYEADDLFDPVKNARAAYLLYQRSGGWAPWGG